MADEKEELKLINHLLDVEKDANAVIGVAMETASKKVEAARTKYNQEYKQQIEKIIDELKNKYEASINHVTQEHTALISDYEHSLEAKEQHYNQFKEVVDRLLKEGV